MTKERALNERKRQIIPDLIKQRLQQLTWRHVMPYCAQAGSCPWRRCDRGGHDPSSRRTGLPLTLPVVTLKASQTTVQLLRDLSFGGIFRDSLSTRATTSHLARRIEVRFGLHVCFWHVPLNLKLPKLCGKTTSLEIALCLQERHIFVFDPLWGKRVALCISSNKLGKGNARSIFWALSHAYKGAFAEAKDHEELKTSAKMSPRPEARSLKSIADSVVHAL
eukprot:6298578-Amphidinium_carterae.1